MAIEFIYFDLGRVLLDFDHQRGCRQMAEVAGVTAEQVSQALFGVDAVQGGSSTHSGGLQRRFELGEIDREEFYELFCQAIACQGDCPPPELAALERAGCDIFRLNAEMLPVVNGLQRTGYSLGLLSNTCESHWDHCRAMFPVLERSFEKVVLSFEEKSMKPDREIYLAAIETAGVAAEQILFIDDRVDNVQGARFVSIEAIQYVDALQLAANLRTLGVRLST